MNPRITTAIAVPDPFHVSLIEVMALVSRSAIGDRLEGEGEESVVGLNLARNRDNVTPTFRFLLPCATFLAHLHTVILDSLRPLDPQEHGRDQVFLLSQPLQ